LKRTKGYRWGRKSKKRAAKQAIMKAWSYSTRDRKARKGEFRALWQMRINAAARANGLTYGTFMSALRKKQMLLDRKSLADIAMHYPDVFKTISDEVRK